MPQETSPSPNPPAELTAVDDARLAAVLAAVPVDGLEVREGGLRDCAPGCGTDLVRTTLYAATPLPERTWAEAAGWLTEAVTPWHEDGWQIVYSVCGPTRAGTALVRELAADGEPFVALAELDTALGTRSVQVTVPLAAEDPDPWGTTRTMLPDSACWSQDVPPKEVTEQSTAPDTET